MFTPEEMREEMGGVRDKVLEIILRHEKEDHDGQPCIPNRAGTVAYLAHTLGVRDGEQWILTQYFASKYDENCLASRLKGEKTGCLHPDL